MVGTEINRNKKVAVGVDNVNVSQKMFGAKRKMITFVNTSPAGQVLSIAIGEEAKDKEGIVLYPTGSHSEGTNFASTQDEINVISDVAGGTLAVYERIEV